MICAGINGLSGFHIYGRVLNIPYLAKESRFHAMNSAKNVIVRNVAKFKMRWFWEANKYL